MLRLSGSLSNQPVVSLRSGGPIAVAIQPIINPHNLKILGWWCSERGTSARFILLPEDVRQASSQGLAVDSEESLCLPEDLVRHKEILAINFELIGKPVKTKRQKIGKVSDYSYNEGMFIQKLYVSVPLVKILASSDTRIIDRNQILEVTDHHILVKDAEVTEGAEMPAAIPA